MKSLRCLLGFHKDSDWVPVRYHLERECPRCGRVDVRYPPMEVMLAHVAVELFMRYSALKNAERYIPSNHPAFRKRFK